MEKGKDSSLFVNDGSFMERFKQLQQQTAKEKASAALESKSVTSTPKLVISRTNVEVKANDSRKSTPPTSNGKLAFSLQKKSKLVAPPVKLGEDDDENDDEDSSCDLPAKRQRPGDSDASGLSSRRVDVAPPSSPSDPTVKKVVGKLASFVAKKGRQLEDVTHQTPPGNTLQRGGSATVASSSASSSQGVSMTQSNYQIPASALYEPENKKASMSSSQPPLSGRSGKCSEQPSTDTIAMMEYYMKKAAAEEKLRAPKQSNDEMPPPTSLQASAKRGHHMGDYIPPEELQKFLSACNDVAAQKAAKEAAERNRIQADNVGHKLLSKMGWREGEGLGSSRRGIADPIMAGGVKSNNLGVGAHQPGEVTPDDDIYEQYKKRMMLGYRYRPNPLNNPRKPYY